ncbi:MAG: transcriptional repressor [Gemmataceae bacterium]|nr:transcriptional repressor [Gemmataceae bacterium]
MTFIRDMDMTRAAIDHRLHAFRGRCGELGLSLTPQRLAIYQVLASDDSHPGAEDIYRRIKPDLPSLSLGTVYRTLELFEEHGLVSRVHAFGDQARFDANLDSHHHLVCIRCRRVIDFQDAQLERLPVKPEGLNGFRVLTHRIHLLGVCHRCQTDA